MGETVHNKKSPLDDDSIYEDLKGFFPSKYDLTPAQLETIIKEGDATRMAAQTAAEQIKRRESAAPRSYSKSPALTTMSSIPKEEKIAETSGHETDVIPEKPFDDEFTDDISTGPADSPQSVFFPDYEQADLSSKADSAMEEPVFIESDPFLESDADEEEKKAPPLIRFLNEAFDILEIFVLCTTCIILLFSFAARLTRVDGDSMNDTLQNGEFLVVSDLFYEPTAGDIVVLQNTSLEHELLKKPLVKRIIAVGGETVKVDADGTVTITEADGTSRTLDEPYIKNELYYRGEVECYVPEGSVFVMGDNRNNSTDSRDPRVGIVDERCICGRVILRLLPFNTFSAFKNPYET